MILILLQSLSFVIYADETGYEVELIIFEDTTNRYLHSEDWRYNDKLNKKEKQPEGRSTPTIDREYKELNWGESKLISQYNRIKNNKQYRILATKRWKQTGLDRKHAFNIPVNIQTNENILSPSSENQSVVSLENKTDIESPNNDTNAALSANALILPGPTKPYITGNVKLIMSRYLHFNINLQYVKPQAININQHENFNVITEENNSLSTDDLSLKIPIVNERRMRSREVHYIDHPLVGVIVLATPYKIKSLEVENKQPTTYKTM